MLEDLADDEPVAEHANRGQVLLDGRDRSPGWVRMMIVAVGTGVAPWSPWRTRRPPPRRRGRRAPGTIVNRSTRQPSGYTPGQMDHRFDRHSRLLTTSSPVPRPRRKSSPLADAPSAGLCVRLDTRVPVPGGSGPAGGLRARPPRGGSPGVRPRTRGSYPDDSGAGGRRPGSTASG